MARLRLTIITTATFLTLAAFIELAGAAAAPGGSSRAVVVGVAGQVVDGWRARRRVWLRRARRGIQ